MKKILLIVMTLLLTGCSADMKDMYNLAFPTSLAIDYKDDEYKVTMQIINSNSLSKPELESSINKGEILITSETGISIRDALQKLENKLRMQIVLTTINTVFLTPNMTKKKAFDAFLNYLFINPEIRLTTSIFINEGDIEDIYKVKHNITSSPYFSLVAYTSKNNMNSLELPDKAVNIMKNYYNNKDVSIIPMMSTDKGSNVISEGKAEDQPRYNIEKIAILDCQTFKSFDMEDIKGLQYITDKDNKNVIEKLKLEDTTINFLIEQTNKETSFKEGHFVIDVEAVVAIGASDLDLPEKRVVEEITRYIQESIYNTYTTLLKQQVDYLRLQNLNSTPLNKDNLIVNVAISLETKTNYLK